ncbi:MAG TPA: hypothetical protein PLY16_01530 [Candidatus Saccharibacteria bacterium]|nr:hypothetical protein [Candidatus Saccharibacteria bacterium]
MYDETETTEAVREQLVANIRRSYAWLVGGTAGTIMLVTLSAIAIAAERELDSLAPLNWVPFMVFSVFALLIVLWMIANDLGRSIQHLVDHSSSPEESPEDN